MRVTKHGHTLTMDSRFFSAKGVDFEIVGTQIINGRGIVKVKNLSNNKKNEIEHQKLCRLILENQIK